MVKLIKKNRRLKEIKKKNIANKWLNEWNLNCLKKEKAESKKENEKKKEIIYIKE